MKGTYYRWTRDQVSPGLLDADILGAEMGITANTVDGMVGAVIPTRPLSPDEARMIGVRLIEAAALAGSSDAIRER